MSRRKPPRPTDAELALLRVLWQRGPSTVRQVHEAIQQTPSPGASPVGYTTILKLLQIMTDKGLVVRDESQRTHVYAPRLAEDQTQRQLLGDLLERAFAGSARKLILQALSVNKASPEELAEIRALLDRIEKEQS